MLNLPKKVKLSINDILDDEEVMELMDKVTDKLSDTYGFCVNDFELEVEIEAKDINWDTTD
jgi:hypothetical protein